MIVSVHQPNFIPWLGLFQRVSRASTHVILDHVQAPRGKGWTNRNKILSNGGPRWLTLPIIRSGGSGQRISDILLSEGQHNLKKTRESLRHAYHDAPNYNVSLEVFDDSYINRGDSIADLNEGFLRNVLDYAGCHPLIVRSTKLVNDHAYLGDLSGNELVLEIARVVGAKVYLSGTGCLDFIKPQVFEDFGIKFYFVRDEQPPYRQLSAEFQPNLSVLDHLAMLDRPSFMQQVAGGETARAVEQITR